MTNQYDKNTDWIAKEQRELFCKAINSIIMTDITKLVDLDSVMGAAEKIVNKAFELYPDKTGNPEIKEPQLPTIAEE